MVVLGFYVFFVLGFCWVWVRYALRRPRAGSAAPASPPPSSRAASRREPRRWDGGTALTEDDVIAFGLALESTEDVVQSALADPSRPPAPAEPRVRRDVPGPS